MRTGASLIAMRRVATGLLLAMVATFVIARRFEDVHPAIAFVRAFAEAATVGALADWFAVTALFRRPLGLPIPHTAIIPRSKDRIGAGLGRFLENNFLSPDLVSSRLEKVDILGEASNWLLQPGRRESVARAVAEALPRLIDLVDDAPVERALREFAAARLKDLDLAGLLAEALTFLTADGRHNGVLDHLIRATDDLLTDSENDIRRRIRAESGWFSRFLSVDKRAADAIVAAARRAISEMAENPENEMRGHLEAALRRLAEDLRNSAELRAEIEAVKARVLEHPEMQAFASVLWRDVKRDFTALADRGAASVTTPIANAIGSFAARVQADAPLRTLLNARLRGWAVRLADARGGDVSRFVAETIQGWDASTMIARIEEGVGADLQFIRISGTLVGGLVGLALHALTLVGYR